MSMLLTVIVPVFAVIVMGRLAVLRGFTDPAAVRGMTDLVFYVAMPCLLFDAIVRAEALRVADSTALFLAVSLGIYAVGMALGVGLLRQAFAPAAVTGLNAAFGNAVMMGIPIVVAAFGPDALPPLLGIITIHSVLILPLATILIEFGGARREGQREGPGRVLHATLAGLSRNPVILVMLAAFLWRGLGIPLPEVLHGFLKLFGAAGPPLALFCLGATLPPLAASAGVIREVLLACALRLAIAPALMLGAGWALGMGGTAFKVAVLISGMPTGANAFLLARRTDTGMEASAATVVLATMLSVLSLSVLLTLLG
jgi:malonate transporter